MGDVKKLCFFFFIISVLRHCSPAQKEISLPVEERIKLLKFQIKEQLKAGRHHHHRHRHQKKPKRQNVEENVLHLENEEYEYVDVDSLPITPVMDFDDRKREQKFKLRQLKTTTTTEPTYAPATTTEYNYDKEPMRSAVLKPQAIEQPVDSFYRRYVEKDIENVPVEWLHCQDMIKPYVVGVKKELQPPVHVEERSYARFMQLLSENITSYSKDEVISHLYQISNVNVRLFQWNVPSLMKLMSLITQGQRHTFKTIVYGIRELFERWHLDYGNTTNLLKQSRIFRPPCVRSDHYGGSTKSSGAVRYAKPTTPTTTCDKDRTDEDK